MKFKKKIILIGMMGSGKSTIGKILANKLGVDFIDIDRKIEISEKMQINTIFEKRGENYFRKIEETLTLSELEGNFKIISLGGGAFINENIRKAVLKNNLSFWLQWNNETLVNRIYKSKKRPKIDGLSKKDIDMMITSRSSYYKMASYKIFCENLDKSQIIKKIIKLYGNKKN